MLKISTSASIRVLSVLSVFITKWFDDINVLGFCFVWWLCMAINISVQYNGRLLSDIILLTQGYYHRGNPFKYHVVALSSQPM